MILKRTFTPLVILILTAMPGISQETEASNLSVHLGELTAPDFTKAVEKSRGTCIIPVGIIEKHGAHLPLSTDLLIARKITSEAAAIEYAVVYPEYYFGQIFEARHQPGTIAYSQELIWKMLEETCEELSRNGLKKIVIVNGHGGNTHFFSFFCQSQLAARKDYLVVLFTPDDSAIDDQVNELRKTNYGGHADEVETSMVHAIRPDLVHAELARSQSGEDQDRLGRMPYGYTGIWWYASYPNHYAGDGSAPQESIGEIIFNSRAKQLSALIKFLKEDDSISGLQNRFYSESESPLETEQ
ncbi:MAG: creatininase family protein [Bacteroidales bacterium]|nr:creatininase family protein [Bacteroidales bacterium]